MIKSIQLCFILLMLVIASLSAQTKILTGIVKDRAGNILQGAAISIKNSTISSVTNSDGKFRLVIPVASETLVIHYGELKTQHINIKKKFTVNIQLQPVDAELSDVISIGYGTMKKADVTSSVTGIRSKDIKHLPLAGADQMLQGKIAGVNVMSNGGQPGGGITMLVHGITSVNNNAPLYVVDGVPIHTNTISGGSSYLGGINGQTQQNILATLNPLDILAIDILKDASAQAIYGADGGNGVILITTKQGASTANKIEYDVYYGEQSIQKKLPLMNLKEYAQYYNTVLNDPASGVIDTIGEFKNLSFLTDGTNWQNAIFQKGFLQNHQLSFSGLHTKTNYYLSANYYDAKGILLNTGFKRYTLRAAADEQIKSWLKAGVSINLSSTNQQLAATDGEQTIIENALYNSPVTPVKNFDGSYFNTISVQGILFGNMQNPVALALLRDVYSKQDKVIGNIYADVHLAKNLKFTGRFGYDYQLTDNNAFQPYVQNDNGTIILPQSKSGVEKIRNNYYNFQDYFTYTRSFNKNVLSAIAGHEYSILNYNNAQASVVNLPDSNRSLNAGTPDSSSPAKSYRYKTKTESFFARFNYIINNKYALTVSGRTDGSSNYTAANRWNFYPAASFSWTISNEPFAKGSNTFTFLKLSMGAGTAGISTAPPYLYSTNTRFTYYFGQLTMPGINVFFGDNNLRRETVTTYNIGADATIAKHVDVSIDAYKKISKNILLPTQLPGFYNLDNATAISYQIDQPAYVNAGKILNAGIDINITSRNIQHKKFTWVSNVVFSHYTNKVNALPANYSLFGKSQSFAPVNLTATINGAPVGSFYGYVTDGIFRSQDELAKAPNQGLPVGEQGLWIGDIRYKDLNGDGKITAADQTIIGNPNPKFNYGVTNNFSYKSFNVSIFLQGIYGDDILNYSRIETAASSNIYHNQLISVMDRVTTNNPNGSLPRFNQYNQNNVKISDRFIEDGSYLRIQNITLGYNLPAELINHIKMSSCKIYVAAQNVYTLTKYSGYDPELGAFNSNALLQNIDFGHYPNPRSILVGANIVF